MLEGRSARFLGIPRTTSLGNRGRNTNPGPVFGDKDGDDSRILTDVNPERAGQHFVDLFDHRGRVLRARIDGAHELDQRALDLLEAKICQSSVGILVASASTKWWRSRSGKGGPTSQNMTRN